MTAIVSIGTYLPTWGTAQGRVPGPDEDAVTLAVDAGRMALTDVDASTVRRVVFVSRDLPLFEGGNGAPLLAGLGLGEDIEIVEQIGGAPAVLDAITGAADGTLVVAADLAPAGAAAAMVGAEGTQITGLGRVVRSLPIQTRGRDGLVRNYQDPRLESVVGHASAVERLALADKPDVVAGTSVKGAAAFVDGKPPVLPVTGASSAIFALAALTELGTGGTVLALEQASASAAHVADAPVVHRDEVPFQDPLRLTETPGPDIAISLAAYERAFESKVRWDAGACDACGTLALPPRARCLSCGSESGWSYAPLPRSGEVYSGVTIHVPVPGLPTPYSLAIVSLDGVDVRALVKVTGVAAGTTEIGDRGTMVLRRVAVRSGVPDYSYALRPDAALEGGTR